MSEWNNLRLKIEANSNSLCIQEHLVEGKPAVVKPLVHQARQKGKDIFGYFLLCIFVKIKFSIK